jgi:hypothetical protein
MTAPHLLLLALPLLACSEGASDGSAAVPAPVASAATTPPARDSVQSETAPPTQAGDWDALRRATVQACREWDASAGARKPELHPARVLLARVAAAAERAAGTPAELEARLQLALLGARGARDGVEGAEKARTDALAALAKRASDAALAPVLDRLGDQAVELGALEPFTALFAEVRARTDVPVVREAATWALVRARSDALDALTAEQARELRTSLEGLASTQPPTRRSRAAADLLAASRDVRVMQVLPPVEALDLEARPVDLAAFRGRVLVVHFWGEAGDPLRREVEAHARRLERHAQEPFAMLGVVCGNVASLFDDRPCPAELAPVFERYGRLPRSERAALPDDDRRALEQLAESDRDFARKALVLLNARWRHAVDGPGGPWMRRWDVRTLPSTWVLDAEGRLRFRDLPTGELDRAIEMLLAEAGKK